MKTITEILDSNNEFNQARAKMLVEMYTKPLPTILQLAPYFIKNEYGSGENICQDYTIKDDYELYIEGERFNRYEINKDGSYEIISDYEQEIMIFAENEGIEDLCLEFVTRTKVTF